MKDREPVAVGEKLENAGFHYSRICLEYEVAFFQWSCEAGHGSGILTGARE